MPCARAGDVRRPRGSKTRSRADATAVNTHVHGQRGQAHARLRGQVPGCEDHRGWRRHVQHILLDDRGAHWFVVWVRGADIMERRLTGLGDSGPGHLCGLDCFPLRRPIHRTRAPAHCRCGRDEDGCWAPEETDYPRWAAPRVCG